MYSNEDVVNEFDMSTIWGKGIVSKSLREYVKF